MKNKSASPSVLIGLVAALAFAAFHSPAVAVTTNWIGDGDWFDGNNWDNGVPTSSTDAVINNAGKAEIRLPGAEARTLTLGAGPGQSGTVTVDGEFGGTLTVTSCVEGAGQGEIYVGYGGRGTLSITNGGVVYSESGFIAALGGGPGGTVASSGAITVDGEDSTWIVGHCSSAQFFIGATRGNPFEDGGTGLLSITNGGKVYVNNSTFAMPGVFVGTSGTVTGNGLLLVAGSDSFSTRAVVRGTLAPNGTFEIIGRLTLTESSTTLCNVTPAAADRINVSGAGIATLDGRLSVTMDGTFTPAVTRYTLLHAAVTLLNEFSSVSIKYDVNQGFTPQITYDYVANSVYLDLEFDP